MGGDLEIEVIGHQCVKLDAQQSSLGQHAAVLLDEVAEILVDGGIHDDNRLAEQRAHLGAANVEHITQSCQILHGHIVAFCFQTVTQPGTVQKQVQPQFPAGFGQCFQFRQRIKGAQLGGIGNVHQLRLYGMLGGSVGQMGMDRLRHLLCCDFAVLMGHPEHLVSRGLHGAGFMDIDMGIFTRITILLSTS